MIVWFLNIFYGMEKMIIFAVELLYALPACKVPSLYDKTKYAITIQTK